MQIKTAIVIAAVAGVVLGAPANNECTSEYKGELQYNANFAGGRGGDESGVVVYRNGKLDVKLLEENKPYKGHGTTKGVRGAEVEFEKCGDEKDELGNVLGRVKLEKNKCIVPEGEKVRVEECSKKATFIFGGKDEGVVVLHAKDKRSFLRGSWLQGDDEELVLRKNTGVAESELSIKL